MKLFWPKLLASILLGLLVFTLLAWFVLLRPVAQPHTNDPIAMFNHGSIGNESEQGLPYWIWRVLPQMFPEHLPGNADGYASFGLYWSSGAELPVGFAKKTLGLIPRVSINCAFCHQGSYRMHRDEPSTLVPGGAGTRIDLQGYLRFLIAVGQDARFESDRVMEAIGAIYDMPLWERLLYRFLLIPATRSALAERRQRFAWMATRPDWGTGRIDPFNPVKFRELGLGDDGTIGNSDIMPLWALNHERLDPGREHAFHWDGLNRDLREVAVSGAIGDGTSYKTFPSVEPRLDSIIDWIRLQQPPASPFSARRAKTDPYNVDPTRVRAGQALYDEHCAECHSRGGARFRTVIPAFEVGTDRHRLEMWSDEVRERYTAYQDEYPWGFEAFRNDNGYVATELTGLWLKGPYLHNGSVPTLRDLLAPSSERPKSFYRGYDLVDIRNGGFVSEGPEAERYGWYYDTDVPGNGNAGHEFGTELPLEDRMRLLGYLKTL